MPDFNHCISTSCHQRRIPHSHTIHIHRRMCNETKDNIIIFIPHTYIAVPGGTKEFVVVGEETPREGGGDEERGEGEKWGVSTHSTSLAFSSLPPLPSLPTSHNDCAHQALYSHKCRQIPYYNSCIFSPPFPHPFSLPLLPTSHSDCVPLVSSLSQMSTNSILS